MSANNNRENWSGSLGFILAAAGSAVGLGNIWKFPYITGENGGGAFVFIYLICIAVIGLPVMLCEITLGRHTRKDPVGAFRTLNPGHSVVAQIMGLGMTLCGLITVFMHSLAWGGLMIVMGGMIFLFGWTLVGVMGVLAGFLILSFYSVVAGWTIGYIVKSAIGALSFGAVEPAQAVALAGEQFDNFTENALLSIACHAAFMAMCVGIVYKGIRSGIERASKILMPLLFLLLVILMIRGLTLKGATEGVRFFLSPDFSKITTETVLLALGHAFFSLSLGMGAIITYGSYVQKEENLFLSSLSIVALDTTVALLAGLAMFPAVFALGFDPAAGPGLVFNVLPAVFSRMAFGPLWAFLFFLLLMVAALTSGISLLEVVTAFFIDELGWSRKQASVVFGTVIFFLGCACAVSGPVFNALDHISSNWLLPLGGLFIAIFVGWIWGTKKAIEEIRHGSRNFADVHLWSLLSGLKDDPSHNSDVHVLTLGSVWGIFIRFISPIAVIIAFLHTVGWLELGKKKAEAEPPPDVAEQVKETKNE
ncbi:MAG: sodium-dependent transporter [Kiritimatiellia bacterium]|jgi:NSS family neurotransmitter:Na+ symporter|nr:sodium-dependent transporter [Kiritimatiellia bacterium]